MDDPLVMAKERVEKDAGHYAVAKFQALVPEQDWAAFVHSIAAGDQLALHAL